MRIPSSLVVAGLSLWALAGSARADVLLYDYLQNSNLSYTGTGSYYNAIDFRDNREKIAQRFVTQAGGTCITEVSVNVWEWLGNSGTFSVHVYTDNGGAVGTKVATIGTRSLSTIHQAIPGTMVPAVFTGLNVALAADTSYWIVVDSNAGLVGGGLYWGYGGRGSNLYIAPNPYSTARFNYYTTPQWGPFYLPALGMQIKAVADADGDGYGAGSDCDDNDASVKPGAAETCANIAVDNDCDGDTSAAEAADSANYYVDGDGDGYGAGAATKSCATIAGSVTNNTDCDDASAAVRPGAAETCANLGTDNDCDGVNDAAESYDSVSYYMDGDGDGYGAGSATRRCAAISGSVTNSADCNDAVAGINPGATEVCDAGNVDENCNGLADNADSGAADAGKTNFYRDQDNDGYTTNAASRFCDLPSGYEAAAEGDCVDTNNSIYPGAIENCANLGVDNDCDTVNDDAEAVDSASYYTDADADNYGAVNATAQKSCNAVSGKTTDNTDCNDGDAAINAGANEVCDVANVDENCNGLADNADSGAAAGGKTTFYVDADGDTYTTSATGSFCDLPSGYRAALSSPVDCNDASTSVYPGAAETCANDGTDNDCDGEANADSEASDSVNYYVDGDGDTYGAGLATKSCSAISGSVTDNTDCNDGNAAINPGATEVCDASDVDEDCNGLADNADSGAAAGGKTTFYVDADGDTYTTSATGVFCDLPSGYRAALSSPVDCNDSAAAVYPGAPETCADDGTDNDCDGEANADSEASDSVNYYVDGDGDTYGAGSATKSCAAITGSVTNSTDCNDGDAAINSAATEICDAGNVDENCNGLADNADSGAAAGGKTTFYVDADGDTYTTSATGSFCDLPSGYRAALSSPVDCNDASTSVYPGAAETCANDGTDNDCDGEANADSEASDSVNYYVDGDGDTYGAGSATKSCAAISGSVTNSTDCNDASNAVYPGAAENCANDGTDNDCDGEADADSEASDSTTYYADGDGDGVSSAVTAKFCVAPVGNYRAVLSSPVDCNDGNAAIYPGAAEICANDGTDNDCDGEANADSEASDSTNYYTDADSDGFGSSTATAVKSCTAVAGSVTDNSDCDDAHVMYADADGDGHGSGAPVACGLLSNDDNCPSTANADQANLDGDSLGDACDGDIDGDNVANANDAFPRDAVKNVANGTMSSGDLDAYLAGASNVGVDADGMDAARLRVVAANIGHVASGGIVGAFTITAELTAGEIRAILPKVFVGNSFMGAVAVVSVDGAAVNVGQTTYPAMDANQLDAVADNAASVAGVNHVTLTAGLDATAIGALVALAPNGGATIDATGMDAARLAAAVSGSTTVVITGVVVVDAGLSPAQIAEVAAQLSPGAGTTVEFDTAGMDAPRQAAVNTAIAAIVSANGGVNPYCDTTDGDQDGSFADACVTAQADCDDAVANVHPGAVETCADLAVDNDCDGNTAWTEAVDPNTYYRDADGDGYGNVASTTLGCSAPAGYVSDTTDCNDADATLNPATAWYPDADGDGTGVTSGALNQCAQPAGFVRVSGDNCPNDANKLAPGDCGCGAVDTDLDNSGLSDCLESAPDVLPSIVGGASGFKEGDTFVVRFAQTAPRVPTVVASLSVSFDASTLEYVGLAIPQGSDFTNQSVLNANQAQGTLRYVVSSQAGVSGAAAIADVTFRVKTGAAACGNAGLVNFTSIAGNLTTLRATSNFVFTAGTSPLGVIRADGAGPAITGLPASAQLPADAGTAAGAYVAAPALPPVATDVCDGDVSNTVALLITYPDTTTAAAWPSDGMFPVGTTTLRWTAQDTLGNQTVETRTIEVLNHQLLDVGITLNGVVSGNTSRRIRITAGGSEQIVTTAMTGSAGTASSVQLPVAANYGCVRVKDADHSISATAVPAVVGTKWAANVTLRQGDSNDDNIVDIFDFAALVASRGNGMPTNHPSNFNGDALVNNLDLSFISVSFFQVGQVCTSADGAGTPRDRVSVKDLRRAGLGYMTLADLNDDGWVDGADVAHFLQYGAPLPAEPWMPVASEN